MSVGEDLTNSLGLRRNRVKQRWDAGEIALASWAGLADPALVEILALAGFDAAGINLEHAAFGVELVRSMIVAAEAADITPIVRVPSGAWDLALLVLDAGAQGIQVPRVPDAETATRAVEAVRYAPQGRRGAFGNSRAARFGAIPWAEYAESANEEILLAVMIEDERGLRHVEEIAAVDGIDLINVGGADLAESLGIRTPNHPRLRDALHDVAERVHSVGKARLGFTIGHPFLTLSIDELREIGVSYANVAPHPEVLLRQSLTDLVTHIRAGGNANP